MRFSMFNQLKTVLASAASRVTRSKGLSTSPSKANCHGFPELFEPKYLGDADQCRMASFRSLFEAADSPFEGSDTSEDSGEHNYPSLVSDFGFDWKAHLAPDLLALLEENKPLPWALYEPSKKSVAFEEEPDVRTIPNREDEEYLAEKSNDPYPCKWLNTPSRRDLAQDAIDAYDLGLMPSTPSLTNLINLTAYASKRNRGRVSPRFF